MKTIFVVFALFFLGSALSAQVVKTQKVKVSKVSTQSKMVNQTEPLITGKKGLVKKTMVVDRKKLVIQRKK